MERNIQKYNDAADGNVKTNAQYAEEAAALDPSKIYKVLYPFHKEDDTGDKYTNTHRCFGGPCKQSLMQVGNKHDAPGSLPWADNDFFEKNSDEIEKHTQRYVKVSSGVVKGEKELHEAERKAKADWEAKINAKQFLPPANMVVDDIGTRYVTTHRCFGKTCKEQPVLKYEVRNYTPTEKKKADSLAQL